MDIKKDSYYIERVLEGKSSEFTVLINKYKDMVFTIILRVTGNREDAEEAAQDVFLKAFNGLAGYRGTSKFSTWLYRIAYNQAISKVRRKQPDIRSYDSLEFDITGIEGESDAALEQIDSIPVDYLKAAFNKLDETDKTVLTLYYQEECNLKEIALITGLSNANAKVKLFRARKKLMALLEKIFKNELIDHI
ncbi:MAG: sigma-70 family RNA polymerase sigma factor [Bacteroidales bacterium]